MKKLNAKQLRRVLFQTMAGVIDGKVSIPQANAISNISMQIHKSIEQEWEMVVFAHNNLPLDARAIAGFIEVGGRDDDEL